MNGVWIFGTETEAERKLNELEGWGNANVGAFDLDTGSAPPGLEFLDAEIMVRITDNHCLLMTYQARLEGAQRMLRHVLVQAGFTEESDAFKLMPVPRRGFGNRLGDQVKSVGFNFAYDNTAADRRVTETRRGTLGGRLKERVFEMLFPSDADDWIRQSNLQVRVVASYDGRLRGGRLGVAPIEDLAQRVHTDEESEYIIKLKDGTVVTDQDIKVRKEVDLQPFGKTVLYYDAWEEMNVYWRELRQSDIIDW